ncbi:MAG: hypothetical protein Q9208_001100 [Pyrenodesmia sp. 3 TL-2023]
MPEIGEGDFPPLKRSDYPHPSSHTCPVARIVHYLHEHLVGKTLLFVRAQHDENVFGKVGTSAAEVEKALAGKKVVGAKQQGKYFWLVMSSPPHPLFHFGMTGWWKIRNLETAYYKPTKPSEPAWPPKYWKVLLGIDASCSDLSDTTHAFVDSRRFGRIRLVDCPAEEMRNVSPLKENGPDPVVDRDVLTEEWLVQKLQSKHVPVKALLLDQANISGIGNWVGDELLYDAKVHPEQYSNTLTPAQMTQLHKSIHYVCSTAVELRAESDKFPEHWLFKWRWGKGKKDDPKMLPNGERIKFLTVGGRTSAIVPSVQKKTGEVAKDVDGEVEEEPRSKKGKKATVKEEDEVEDEVEADEEVERPKRKKSKKSEATEDEDTLSDSKPSKPTGGKSRAVKRDAGDATPPDQPNGTSRSIIGDLPERMKAKRKPKEDLEKNSTAPRVQKAARPAAKSEVTEEKSGQRRSARVSGAAE